MAEQQIILLWEEVATEAHRHTYWYVVFVACCIKSLLDGEAIRLHLCLREYSGHYLREIRRW
jgi:hypothetical protein